MASGPPRRIARETRRLDRGAARAASAAVWRYPPPARRGASQGGRSSLNPNRGTERPQRRVGDASSSFLATCSFRPAAAKKDANVLPQIDERRRRDRDLPTWPEAIRPIALTYFRSANNREAMAALFRGPLSRQAHSWGRATGGASRLSSTKRREHRHVTEDIHSGDEYRSLLGICNGRHGAKQRLQRQFGLRRRGQPSRWLRPSWRRSSRWWLSLLQSPLQSLSRSCRIW